LLLQVAERVVVELEQVAGALVDYLRSHLKFLLVQPLILLWSAVVALELLTLFLMVQTAQILNLPH
jgi:hypothetical protein